MEARKTVPVARCPNCSTPISIFQALLANRHLECRACGYALSRQDGIARFLAIPGALLWIGVMQRYGVASVESGLAALALCGACAMYLLLVVKVELRRS